MFDSAAMKLVCIGCGAVQDNSYTPLCVKCGKLNNPHYDLKSVRLRDSDNPYTRYFDLLPVRDRILLPSEAVFTPTIHAKDLGKFLSMSNLYLKNETVLKTGTTKFRMASVALAYLQESGVTHFCTASTGNSSNAYAQLIGNTPKLKVTLFTASDFRRRMNFIANDQIKHFILEGASFAEAFEYAGKYAREKGYTAERGFFNPGRREGLKLAFFEAVDQVPTPIDWYVQGVSSAMGVYGTFSGAKELLDLGHIPYLPHLLCCQQESCSPMAKAWAENCEKIKERHIVRNPTGIAMAILRGDPTKVYPYLRSVVRESGGEMTWATEAQIKDARRLVLEEEGIDICFSAATAVAGLIKMVKKGRVSREDTVLINLTGSDQSADVVPAVGTLMQKVKGQWCLSG
jgi:threonine synthase